MQDEVPVLLCVYVSVCVCMCLINFFALVSAMNPFKTKVRYQQKAWGTKQM